MRVTVVTVVTVSPGYLGYPSTKTGRCSSYDPTGAEIMLGPFLFSRRDPAPPRSGPRVGPHKRAVRGDLFPLDFSRSRGNGLRETMRPRRDGASTTPL
jgi:hypothetical protein